jgi:hypothetical protein
MVPAQRQLLLDSLVSLSALQSIALADATFLGWTEESLRAYEERCKMIAEIQCELA